MNLSYRYKIAKSEQQTHKTKQHLHQLVQIIRMYEDMIPADAISSTMSRTNTNKITSDILEELSIDTTSSIGNS